MYIFSLFLTKKCRHKRGSMHGSHKERKFLEKLDHKQRLRNWLIGHSWSGNQRWIGNERRRGIYDKEGEDKEGK